MMLKRSSLYNIITCKKQLINDELLKNKRRQWMNEQWRNGLQIKQNNTSLWYALVTSFPYC